MMEFTYKLLEDDSYCVMTYTGDEPDVIIPDEFLGRPVTILYEHLFEGHTEITSVRIPDSVTDIGGFNFDGCVNLRSITLPPALEHLWQYAFVRSSIEELTIPDRVRRIVPYTFKDCKELRKVVCGAALREIGPWAFDGCEKLKELICGPGTLISPDAYASKELKPWRREQDI